MSQRLCSPYDREERYFYSDVGCNQEKGKNNRMSEIESYVNLLIENNKNYAEEINTLKRQNSELRGGSEIMMKDILKLKEIHSTEMTTVREQFGSEVTRLIEELKDILRQREAMENSYKSIIHEISLQSQYDRNQKLAQIENMESSYELKIRKMSEKLNEQHKEAETNYYVNSDNKLRMVQEIDNLNYEVNELRKGKSDLVQENIMQSEEIIKLSNMIRLASQEKEEAGINLLKLEQDKNQLIMELKKNNAKVREELDRSVENIKRLESFLVAKEKDLNLLTQKFQSLKREKNTLEDTYQLTKSTLGQKDKKLSQLEADHARLSQFSNKQLRRTSELIRLLEADNKKMLEQREDLNEQNNAHAGEIYNLLNRLKGMEVDNQKLECDLLHHQEESILANRTSNSLKEELQTLVLENKSQHEKLQLQANHIVTLEQLIEKEKRRNGYLESTQNDLEYLVRENPKEISKKYTQEIDAVVKHSHAEKNQMREKFSYEKDKLIRMYETALREKEITFKEKIQLLEREMLELSK